MKRYYLVSFAVVGIFVVAFAVVGFIFSLLYPFKYKNEITNFSNKYGLQPEFVASVINVESGFNRKATSSAGAIGLMQLMPSTAIEIAEALEYENFKISDLYEPSVNIEFGCYYLSYLNHIFSNNINNVLAGYNAGLNKVAIWLENENYSIDGETIIQTPYNETNNFMKKVKNNVKIYSKRF